MLDTSCPICGLPIEVIFDERPSEIELLEAEQIPCDDCLEEAEDSELADEILKQLFEDDHPKQKN